MNTLELARSYSGTAQSTRLSHSTTIPEALRRVDSHAAALVAYEGGKLRDRWTYGELRARISYMAQALLGRGVEHGDRVVVVSQNCAEMYVCLLALLSIGAIAVPIANNESSDAANFIIRKTEPRLVVRGRAIESKLNLSHGKQVELNDLFDFRATHIPELVDVVRPDDMAVILFTSGTTSVPKGVCLSHYNLLCNAEGLRRAHGLDEKTVALCLLPLFHTNAYGFSMVASIYAGGSVVLCDEFPGFALWNVIEHEGVRIVSAVPTILRSLAMRRRLSPPPTLDYFTSAAAPLPKDLLREFERQTGTRVHQGYGLSEATNFSAVVPAGIDPNLRERLANDWDVPSIGPALFGNDLDIVDSDGASCEAGQEGEVVVRGHNVMMRYWRAEQDTSQALFGGRLHTGDKGFFQEIDGERYFFLTGRLKEIIIRHGENISPVAVERTLYELSKIGNYAVCGFTNTEAGEEIGVFVDASPTDEVLQRIAKVLLDCPAKYRPAVALVGSTPIPATSTGKIKRSVLSRSFEPHRDINNNGRPKILGLQ